MFSLIILKISVIIHIYITFYIRSGSSALVASLDSFCEWPGGINDSEAMAAKAPRGSIAKLILGGTGGTHN